MPKFWLRCVRPNSTSRCSVIEGHLPEERATSAANFTHPSHWLLDHP